MKYFILVFSYVLLVFSNCFALELNEEDNNENFSVKVGENIALRLNANATTGYKWSFNIPEEQKQLVKILKEKYEIKPHPKGMVGVGGKAVYKIKAIKPGKFIITARYYRPWEEFDPAKDKELKFIIEIKEF